MSDAQVFLAVIGLITLLINSLFAYMTLRLQKHTNTLQVEQNVVSRETHALVNGQRGELLKVAATSARALALYTHSEEHAALARNAELNYKNHLENEARMNEVKEKGEVVKMAETPKTVAEDVASMTTGLVDVHPEPDNRKS